MWQTSWVSLDTETTGFGKDAHVLELGIVYFEGGEPVEEWGVLLDPPGLDWFHPQVQDACRINGLTKKACAGGPSFPQVAAKLREFLSEPVVVGHNIEFDLRMVRQELERYALAPLPDPALTLCTMQLDHKLSQGQAGFKLMNSADRWGVFQPDAHRAVIDAKVSGQVLQKMIEAGRLPDEVEPMALLQKAATNSWSTRRRK